MHTRNVPPGHPLDLRSSCVREWIAVVHNTVGKNIYMVRYDAVRKLQDAQKNWRVASLVCRTRKKTEILNE